MNNIFLPKEIIKIINNYIYYYCKDCNKQMTDKDIYNCDICLNNYYCITCKEKKHFFHFYLNNVLKERYFY